MEITRIYAIVIGGILVLFVFTNWFRYISQFIRYLLFFMSKHLAYTYLLRRHRFLGPWTRAEVLIQAIYMTTNLFCLFFRVSKLSQASLRAGKLSLINMIPLLAGPHLSFLADILGVSVTSYRSVHRSGGLVSFTLGLCHVIMTAIGGGASNLISDQHLFELIVSLLSFIIAYLLTFFRAPFLYV